MVTTKLIRVTVTPPQSLADAHTLVAQKYAGYFLGHPYRAAQQKVGPNAIEIDWSREWREPPVVADDCEFCARLTDAEAERRLAGYQYAIDIEAIRPYGAQYADWLARTSGETALGALTSQLPSMSGIDAKRRRQFLEEHEGTFLHRAISMVSLPLRLKRKLCIEWNHLYVDWLQQEPGVRYDPDTREFYREQDAITPQDPAAAVELFAQWWGAFAATPPAAGEPAGARRP